jgi:YVTN family beta-propeller protein
MGATSERPSGTVTFLFSDIEGSTRLLQRLGARYAEALAEHQRLLREAFAEHGGHEIDTQGDSFFVAFRRAKDAVAAAVSAQRALAVHEWPDGVDLLVRMGIHTGEPVAGEERYVGLGVHRAARIGAAAVGGQVLVSETTRSLLRDDPPAEVRLRDLGLRALKDIDEPERLYELDAPGLVNVELTPPAGPLSRGRLVIGAVFVTVAVAAGLGTLLSRGGGGTANAARAVEPNQLGVIDTTSGSITARVAVGVAPNGVAAGDGALWVANTDDNSVARVDPSTETVRQTIPVGGSPAGLAVSPGAVWVANGSDGTVSRIDPATNQVVQTIAVGNGPDGVAYGAGKVWIANSADGTISEIDPASGRVERTLPGAVGVTALAVAFGHVWAVAPAGGNVVEFDPHGGSATTVGVGVSPDAIAAAAGAIWVANRQDGTVSRIDPRSASVTATVTVGHDPDAIAGSGSSLWVANAGDGTLSRIDPATDNVVKTLSLANPPQGLAASGHDLYVSVRSSGAANRGGTLRVLDDRGLDSLDPAFAYSPTAWSVLVMTNDGLVGLRRVGGAEGVELVPDLATALPVPTDGGRTYTFTLRPQIYYSDGKLVEPDDVRAAIERVLTAKPASPTRFYFTRDIVGASRCRPGKPCNVSAGIVTDRLARTVTFHLAAPDPDFLMKLAMPPAFPVPAGTPARQRGTVPATGPYMVASRKRGKLVLVRNPRFREWSQDAQPEGFPDKISMRVLPGHGADPNAQARSEFGQVERGTEDVALVAGAPPLPNRLLEELATRYPSQLRLSVEPATWYLFLNTRVPPFDDVRVRQAVEEVFDRQAFGHLLPREYTATCNILPPGYAGYRRSCPYRGSRAARLEKARALVRASGKLGARVVVWTPAPVAFEGRFMSALLGSLGFHASVHTLPASKIETYFATILDARKRVQTGYIGWIADYPSSLGFFQQQFSCAGFTPGNWQTNSNVSELCDRRVDAEIHRAAEVQVLDPPAATLLWQKLERDILALAPMVPAYNGRAVVLLSKRVGNFQYNPQWGVLLDQLWVR